MSARAIAVACLALALSARAYGVEPAKGGGASGSERQASKEPGGKETGGEAAKERTQAPPAAKPSEQGTGSASAQKDPAATEKDPAARARQTPQMQSIVGTVEKLEGDSLTVKSSPLSDPHRLKLSADTKFLRDGESISRDQIAEGDQVRASVVGEGASQAAAEISVIKKGEGKAGTRTSPGSSSSGSR